MKTSSSTVDMHSHSGSTSCSLRTRA
jgi:hypothetical protein